LARAAQRNLAASSDVFQQPAKNSPLFDLTRIFHEVHSFICQALRGGIRLSSADVQLYDEYRKPRIIPPLRDKWANALRPMGENFPGIFLF